MTHDSFTLSVQADIKPLEEALEKGEKLTASFSEKCIEQFETHFLSSLEKICTDNVQNLLPSFLKEKTEKKTSSSPLFSSLIPSNFIKPLEQILAGSSFFGRAGGGTVSPGQSYIVGERGPEIFHPRQTGQIESEAFLPKSLPISQKRPIHLTMNIQSDDTDSFKRTQSQLMHNAAEYIRLALDSQEDI